MECLDWRGCSSAEAFAKPVAFPYQPRNNLRRRAMARLSAGAGCGGVISAFAKSSWSASDSGMTLASSITRWAAILDGANHEVSYRPAPKLGGTLKRRVEIGTDADFNEHGGTGSRHDFILPSHMCSRRHTGIRRATWKRPHMRP